ncbi:MAG: response regulator [Limnospira sp.]
MQDETYKILLIEHRPGDQEQIRQLLGGASSSPITRGMSFELTDATELSEGLDRLNGQSFDLLLFSLDLPDHRGIETLVELKKSASQIPVVILTDDKDEAVRVQAMQLGAQGYLVKDQIDSSLLLYSIRLAIEGQQQLKILEQNQWQQFQELEFQGLAHLADSIKTNVTAKLFGLAPLREAVPDIFSEIVEKYGKLLELALEKRAYKVEHNISDHLRSLAEQLGFLKASPRDLIEIHTQVLKQKTQNANVVKTRAYVVEGRLMVLELMGYLTSFYRKYFIGLSKLNISKNYEDLSQG